MSSLFADTMGAVTFVVSQVRIRRAEVNHNKKIGKPGSVSIIVVTSSSLIRRVHFFSLPQKSNKLHNLRLWIRFGRY